MLRAFNDAIIVTDFLVAHGSQLKFSNKKLRKYYNWKVLEDSKKSC
jgi:hypothetical protein